MKYAMAAHHCKSKVNDSARCEQNTKLVLSVLPNRRLSFAKIVQGERSAKRKTRFLICTSEPQPILFKDSAR